MTRQGGRGKYAGMRRAEEITGLPPGSRGKPQETKGDYEEWSGATESHRKTAGKSHREASGSCSAGGNLEKCWKNAGRGRRVGRQIGDKR